MIEDLDLYLPHPFPVALLDEVPALIGRDGSLAVGADRKASHPGPQAGLADPEIASGLRESMSLDDEVEGSTPAFQRAGCGYLTDSFWRGVASTQACGEVGQRALVVSTRPHSWGHFYRAVGDGGLGEVDCAPGDGNGE